MTQAIATEEAAKEAAATEAALTRAATEAAMARAAATEIAVARVATTTEAVTQAAAVSEKDTVVSETAGTQAKATEAAARARHDDSALIQAAADTPATRSEDVRRRRLRRMFFLPQQVWLGLAAGLGSADRDALRLDALVREVHVWIGLLLTVCVAGYVCRRATRRRLGFGVVRRRIREGFRRCNQRCALSGLSTRNREEHTASHSIDERDEPLNAEMRKKRCRLSQEGARAMLYAGMTGVTGDFSPVSVVTQQ